MAINDLDARILRAKGLGPDRVENGQDALAPSSPASAGQTDATLRFDPAAANRADKSLREAEAAKKAAVQEITMPSADPAESNAVTVGSLRMYPQTISGYEANFTRGGHDPYVFEQDGERLTLAEGLRALYAALKTNTKEKKK